MRQLFYTNYQSGNSGLSNGIMSVEIGVVLAFLTNRFLLLDGNVSPPANVVSYDGRVNNDQPSRVTDLIEIPVPWSEPDAASLVGVPSRELTDEPLGQATFYVPGTVDPESTDARYFARGRTTWLSANGALEDVPLLRVSEEPLQPDGYHRHNLSYYSYFFYLDNETRRSVYRILTRMGPMPELAALAEKVASDIGSFNAVHMRRGDFKVTYGVTVLDRQPWEAIEALDNHFKRQDTLVIVTDERDDPFFDEIKAAYPNHIFIDHHILDEYGRDFDQLRHKDSIALAYLSQLVAAESADFIGTMTSTFTAIIQRYRGNRGKFEPFKFLWNELPDPSDRIERGRHPVSECIPLDQGIMIEESSGPYTWNRYSARIAANWMREWPESFLTEEVLASGALNGAPGGRAEVGTRPAQLAPRARNARSEVPVVFDGLSVTLHVNGSRLITRLGESFGTRPGSSAENVIAELEVGERGERFYLAQNGVEILQAATFEEIAKAVKHHIVPTFVRARRRHVWLEGFSFLRAGHAVLLVGDLGRGADWLPDALCSSGWELLWDDLVPVRVADCTVTPFGRSTWPKGAALRIDRVEYPLGGLIAVENKPHQRDDLTPLSPSVGVAELIGKCIDFRIDRDRATKRLCELVEKRRVGMLTFSTAERGAEAITKPFLEAEREASTEGSTA